MSYTISTVNYIQIDSDELEAIYAEHERLRTINTDLLEACEALIADETSSYCEWCDRHAPKDDEGYLIGPIPHIEGCAVGMARAAIAKAKGEVTNE